MFLPGAGTTFSHAQEKCVFRHGNFPLNVSEKFVGLYQLSLAPPMLENRESLRRHLQSSIIWGRLLAAEMSSKTAGRCAAYVTPYAFPDLRVFFFSRRAFSDIDQRKALCVRALIDAATRLGPADSAIREASASVAFGMRPAQATNAILDQLNIVTAALPQIYASGSPLQVLASVGGSDYLQINVAEFQTWLSEQQSSERIGAKSISQCVPLGDPDASDLQQQLRRENALVPPGEIKLKRNSAIPSGQIRSLVLVRNADARSGVSTEVAAKYCNKRHEFVLNGKQPERISVQIRCQSSTLYDLDSWTALFCEPQDCLSASAQQAVTSALVQDPDLITYARNIDGSNLPAGPYLISIEDQ